MLDHAIVRDDGGHSARLCREDSMLPFLALPFRFSQERLLADLALVAGDEWVPHFNTNVYEGEWSGVSLLSRGGKAMQLYPDPTSDGPFEPTEILRRCAYFQEVLAAFECPMTMVRLLKLKAGSSIRRHKDYKLGYEDGEVRLHVPIITDPRVEFYVDERRVPMGAGECWYVNVNMTHHVENTADIDRVHLVMDCVVNDWLDGYFAPHLATA
jgi:hypothetical protein